MDNIKSFLQNKTKHRVFVSLTLFLSGNRNTTRKSSDRVNMLGNLTTSLILAGIPSMQQNIGKKQTSRPRSFKTSGV